MSNKNAKGKQATDSGSEMEKVVDLAITKRIESLGFFEVDLPSQFFAQKKYRSARYFLNSVNEKILILRGNDLHKFAKFNYSFSLADRFQKKLHPDFALININKERLFILEVKNQNSAGSVDEKLQSTHFKRFYYEHISNGMSLKLHFYWLLGGSFIYSNVSKYEAVINYMTEQGSIVKIFHEDPSQSVAELVEHLTR